MPWIARGNYVRELSSAFFLPWALAATEGGVIGFIVRRLYDGVVPDAPLNFVVGALVAAPALANITSFIWARLAHGRHKIEFINTLQLGILICIAGIALSPRTEIGLGIVFVSAILGRMFWAGVITVRSTVWGLNYPDDARARLTGKFAAVQVCVIALVSLALGKAMETDEDSYRYLLPIGGVIALAGILSYSRIRVRGHRALLDDERNENGVVRPSFNPLRLWSVLANDRRYRHYMTCQFLIGIGNMMSWAPLVIMVEDSFRVDYDVGLLITQSLPLLMMPMFIPLWARFLDRAGIIVFRSVHSWVFVVMCMLLFLGGIADALWLIILAAAIKGIAFGGGALAWNLGHLHFVRPAQSGQYMSVHVTLTGLRGLLAPFLGVALYQLLEQRQPGSGPYLFVLCAAIVVAGAIGFALMLRATPRT